MLASPFGNATFHVLDCHGRPVVFQQTEQPMDGPERHDSYLVVENEVADPIPGLNVECVPYRLR